MLAFLLLALAVGEGRPLYYWGPRRPVIVPDAAAIATANEEARVKEVHAARESGSLFLKLTFDRLVRQAVRLPDGTPVSGRLRAVLYLDADDDRGSGFQGGSLDLRTGADQRLDLGVVAVGADPEERRPAEAVITVSFDVLTTDGRQRTLWRADDAGSPQAVSVHGDSVEIRLPPTALTLAPRARLVLAVGGQAWDGRIE